MCTGEAPAFRLRSCFMSVRMMRKGCPCALCCTGMENRFSAEAVFTGGLQDLLWECFPSAAGSAWWWALAFPTDRCVGPFMKDCGERAMGRLRSGWSRPGSILLLTGRGAGSPASTPAGILEKSTEETAGTADAIAAPQDLSAVLLTESVTLRFASRFCTARFFVSA